MSDKTTTLADLRAEVQTFVDEREWRQFHSPKNLAMSIAIESAELMEHFQWLENAEAKAIVDKAETMQQVREELADILCFALSFANALEIDVSTALREKMVKNAAKYPADRFRGRFR
ncbi:MAG: nucleotide pyrophosphohydrolase [Planctomycetes bacterium]|nr:nucleotide pyrophosphohydrolase [Planctomycetota bacterium]